MAAGLATLEIISKPGFFDRLETSMKRLIDGFNAAAAEAGVDFCARSAGAMGGVYMRAKPPDSYMRRRSSRTTSASASSIT